MTLSKTATVRSKVLFSLLPVSVSVFRRQLFSVFHVLILFYFVCSS